MISDRFNANKRVAGFSLMAIGVPMGGALAAVLGGAMAQAFGWRLAFVAVGLPGLVLALILFRTVPEPARTAAGEDDSTPPFRAVLRRLGKSPAFLNLTCGSGLVGLVGFGLHLFLIPFIWKSVV